MDLGTGNRETASSIDHTLALISHRYRRWTLLYMVVYEKESVSLDRLVQVIQVLDNRTDPDLIRTELEGSHLRKLQYADIIQYEKPETKIYFTGGPFLEAILSTIANQEPHFHPSNTTHAVEQT